MRDPKTSLAPDTAPVPDPRVPKPDLPDASNLLLTAGNLAVQQLLRAAQLPLAPMPFFAAPAPPPQKTAEPPVVIHWSKYAPWLFTVDGSPSASAISIELYGFDATPFRRMVPFVTMMGAFYSAEPELLRPEYRERYYQEMDALLKQDVEELESLIFDDHRVADGMEILRRWAGRGDLRLRSGRTYFDAFLARLRGDYWYRDYLVTTGAKHTFFDSLLDWAGDSAGEVSALIAQNSREFGAYRPDWALVETVIKPQPIGPGGKPADGPKVNPELVTRTADLVLEKLSGRTSSDDSHVIADAMTSLPAAEQLSVIKDIIGRYDERKWLGLVGKYGEAGETGMLYWLFEDLTSEDRERVRKSVVENHVLTRDMAAALVSGRGAISRTFPWITGKLGSLAEERVTFWADKAARGESTIPAYFWGTLDSLFLPQNIDTTVLTLMAPGAFKGVGALSPTAGRLLGLGLTGVGAYDATISLQQVISDHDAYSGDPLPRGGRLASALRLASDIILLGVGFRGARGARGGSDPLLLGPGNQSTALPADALPPETGLAVGTDTALVTNRALATVPGEPQVEWRVLNVNPQTGDMTIIGRSGGEYMVVRMNAGTLDGEVLHPRTGQVVPIRSGFVTIPEARLGGSADASAKTPGADNRPAPVAALPSAQAQIAPPPAATPEAIELHRQVLGTDPSVGGRFRANEADTALRVEAHRRIVLDRFSPAGPNEKGDWFNVANPTEVFDGCSPPRSAFFDLQLANGNYETSLQDHLAHPTVTFVVIDITGLGLSAAQEAALDALILRVAGPNNPKILRIP